MKVQPTGPRLLRILVAAALLCCAVSLKAQGQSARKAEFERLAQAAASERDAGQAQDAIRDYGQALSIRADWAEGWWYLGVLQYDANDFVHAKTSFQKVTNLMPAMGGAWNFLGLCEFETRNYDAALSHLEKGQTLGAADDPEIARVAAYHLALLQIRAGEFKKASNLLAEIFPQAQVPDQIRVAYGLTLLEVPLLPSEIDPSRDALIHAAGDAALAIRNGDRARALELLAELTRNNPDVPRIHHAYSALLTQAGQTAAAQQQEQLEKRLAGANIRTIYGLKTNARATVANAAPKDFWQQATQAYIAHDYSQAAAALKHWLQAKPEDGTAWAMLGLSEFELKDYDNALLHLRRGHELGYGGSVAEVQTANYRLGTLLIHSGQFERATAVLKSRAADGPLSKQIQFALGMALLRIRSFPDEVIVSHRSLVETAGATAELLQSSQYDQAFANFEAMLKQAPDLPFLHYAYGTALIAISRYDEAEKAMRQEVQISPTSELPYLRLASIEIRKRRPEEALAPARKALELAPDSGDAHYLLGRAALETGDINTAVRELEVASKISPNSPEVHFNLAKAYARASLPEKAAAERDSFKRLNAIAEQQRSQTGNQAYQGPREGNDLSESSPR